MKFNFKEFFKGILVICSYFVLQFIFIIPFVFLLIKDKITENTIYLIVYSGLAITYLIAYRKTIKEDLTKFKKNYKSILKTTAKYWIIGFGVMLLSSAIISLIGIGSSDNQNTNLSLFKQAPIMQSFIVIVLAPIIEELVFRRSFKNMTNNKILFALITGLIFGGIHVVSSLTSLKDLIMLIHLIPYCSVGVALGLAYKEHNNIIGTMSIHSLHNIIATLEIFFLL